MALFLTRTLAVDGVLPTGLGFTVVDFDTTPDTIDYDDAGTTKTVDYTGGTSFTVDGVAASIGVFEANLSVGDKIAFTGTSFALTNVTVSGGIVNDVDLTAQNFDVILASGPILVDDNASTGADYVPTNAAYSVGGVAVSVAGFEASLSNGDTISITGAGTVPSPYVFALTNATVTGVVSGVAGDDFNITTTAGAVLGVNDVGVPGTDVLTLTVDGVPATQPTFEAALSNGDAITYGRAAAVITASLTNQATGPSTGRVLTFDTGTDIITLDAGPATAVTTTDYSAFTLTVGGGSSTELEFEAALNVGDTVTYQAASTTPAVTGSIALVNNTVSGTPNTIDTTVGFEEITLWFDTNGPDTAVINYTNPVDANIVNFAGLAGNATVDYTINGVDSDQAAFEAQVAGIIGGLSGTVSVSDSGTVTLWNVVSP
jgi:hypothetical protein